MYSISSTFSYKKEHRTYIYLPLSKSVIFYHAVSQGNNHSFKKMGNNTSVNKKIDKVVNDTGFNAQLVK